MTPRDMQGNHVVDTHTHISIKAQMVKRSVATMSMHIVSQLSQSRLHTCQYFESCKSQRLRWMRFWSRSHSRPRNARSNRAAALSMSVVERLPNPARRYWHATADNIMNSKLLLITAADSQNCHPAHICQLLPNADNSMCR